MTGKSYFFHHRPYYPVVAFASHSVSSEFERVCCGGGSASDGRGSGGGARCVTLHASPLAFNRRPPQTHYRFFGARAFARSAPHDPIVELSGWIAACVHLWRPPQRSSARSPHILQQLFWISANLFSRVSSASDNSPSVSSHVSVEELVVWLLTRDALAHMEELYHSCLLYT